MEDSEIILKDSFRYSVSTYFVTFFGVITSIATRRILNPVLMGVFSELMLIFQYARYHHLGIFNALERELPYYNGRGDLAKVQEIKDTGFTVTSLTSVLGALVIIVLSFIIPVNRNLAIGMRLLSLTLVVYSAGSFLTVLVKTHHKFAFLSKYNLYTTILQVLLTIYLGIKFNLFGILWVNIIIGAVGLFYLLETKFRFRFKFPFSFKEASRLFKIGAPLLINEFAFISLMNMDKFSIIKFFGSTGLGFYSIAIMLASYLFILPNMIYSVLFPRFYESFGRVGDIKKLRHYFETPTTIISYFLAGITGCIILGLPLLIKYILPKYEPGVMAANILLLGMFFVSLLGMSNYLLIAMSKQRQMILLSILGIGLALFFNYFFIVRLKWQIEGAALAMLITYFIYSTAYIWYAFRHHTKSLNQFLVFIIKIYLPFLWLVSVLYVINSFLTYKSSTVMADLLSLFLRLFLFVVAYIPLLYYLNKKTNIMNKILQLIKSPFFRVTLNK